MSIPIRQKIEYERVKPKVWIKGVIEKVEEDPAHKKTFQGKESIIPAVRVVFRLEGYQFPKYTRWMYFSYGLKTKLFELLKEFIENPTEDMPFDIQNLVNCPVNTMWKEDTVNGQTYQNLVMIECLIPKFIVPGTVVEEVKRVDEPDMPETSQDEIPF